MLNCYPQVPNFTPFCSTIAHFLDSWGFLILHRLQWWIWKFRTNRFVSTIGREIQDKFENFWLPFVVGVAVWKFHSHSLRFQFQNFKNSKRSFVRTIWSGQYKYGPTSEPGMVGRRCLLLTLYRRCTADVHGLVVTGGFSLSIVNSMLLCIIVFAHLPVISVCYTVI